MFKYLFSILLSILLAICSETEFLDHMVILVFLNYWMMLQFNNIAQKFQFLLILSTTCNFFFSVLFDRRCPDGYGFDLHFSKISDGA